MTGRLSMNPGGPKSQVNDKPSMRWQLKVLHPEQSHTRVLDISASHRVRVVVCVFCGVGGGIVWYSRTFVSKVA